MRLLYIDKLFVEPDNVGVSPGGGACSSDRQMLIDDPPFVSSTTMGNTLGNNVCFKNSMLDIKAGTVISRPVSSHDIPNEISHDTSSSAQAADVTANRSTSCNGFLPEGSAPIDSPHVDSAHRQSSQGGRGGRT